MPNLGEYSIINKKSSGTRTDWPPYRISLDDLLEKYLNDLEKSKTSTYRKVIIGVSR